MRVAFFAESASAQSKAYANLFVHVFPHLQNFNFHLRYFTNTVSPEAAKAEQIMRVRTISSAFYPAQEEAQAVRDDLSSVLGKFRPDIIHLADTSLVSLLGMSYARAHRLPLVASYSPEENDRLDADYLHWFYGACQTVFASSPQELDELNRLGLKKVQRRVAGPDAKALAQQLRVCYHKLSNNSSSATSTAKTAPRFDASAPVLHEVNASPRRRNTDITVALPQLATA